MCIVKVSVMFYDVFDSLIRFTGLYSCVYCHFTVYICLGNLDLYITFDVLNCQFVLS